MDPQDFDSEDKVDWSTRTKTNFIVHHYVKKSDLEISTFIKKI